MFFDELGIITCVTPDAERPEIREVRVNPYTAKTPLENSVILRSLKMRATNTVLD